MNLHRLAEERSLAYHAAVADRLRQDPDLLAIAHERLTEWIAAGHSPVHARAWQEILARPLDDILAFLVDAGERARELRQSTPFAGFIDPRERWRLWREVRTRWERQP
jgi:hypothetical protein